MGTPSYCRCCCSSSCQSVTRRGSPNPSAVRSLLPLPTQPHFVLQIHSNHAGFFCFQESFSAKIGCWCFGCTSTVLSHPAVTKPHLSTTRPTCTSHGFILLDLRRKRLLYAVKGSRGRIRPRN